ncbi:MAG: hypothetical protein WC980_10360 [Candidatus Brocadiia bacterium]
MYRRRYFTDGQVTTPQITENAITEDKLADDAVTSPKIKNATVQTEDIADKAVTLAKLGDDVPAVGIPDGSITGAKIALDTIEKQNLKTGAVDTAEIAGGAVTEEKIRDLAVTGDKIQDASINPPKVDAVNAPADGQALTYEQASGKFKYATPGGITRPITPPISTDEVGDSQISNAKLQDRAVDWVKIALASINHELLYNLAPPTDGQILSFDAATGKFNWIAPPTGGAGGMQLTLLPSQPLVFSENSMVDIDQLIDLSTWIPATAQAVIVEMQLNAMSVPVGMEQILTVLGRRTGTDFSSSTIHFIWQNTPGNNNNAYKECMLATDTLRQVRVMITKSGVFTSTNVWIKGYIE